MGLEKFHQGRQVYRYTPSEIYILPLRATAKYRVVAVIQINPLHSVKSSFGIKPFANLRQIRTEFL